LSGLPPVGVISELMNDDGTVMKGEQVARFAASTGSSTSPSPDMMPIARPVRN